MKRNLGKFLVNPIREKIRESGQLTWGTQLLSKNRLMQIGPLLNLLNHVPASQSARISRKIINERSGQSRPSLRQTWRWWGEFRRRGGKGKNPRGSFFWREKSRTWWKKGVTWVMRFPPLGDLLLPHPPPPPVPRPSLPPCMPGMLGMWTD